MIQTSAAAKFQQETDNDPNTRQRAAADPQETVWVGASAGTGKTKVLTDRVLRLLLPRADGQPGTNVGKILCLTYTKAAASEMAMRINRTLSAWAVMPVEDANAPDKSLKSALENVLGQDPTPLQITHAQRLFADVMDSPVGLQIMTIHSFCNSVLGRFPLEAGLTPNFTLLEGSKGERLLELAKADVFAAAQSAEEKDSPLGRAFHAIAGTIDERGFMNLIAQIVAERGQMAQMLKQRSIGQVYADICRHYDIAQNLEAGAILAGCCGDDAFDAAGLRSASRAMLQAGNVTSLEAGQAMADWLAMGPQERAANFESYCNVFFTQKGEMRSSKSFPVKAVREIMPDSPDILQAEALRLQEIKDQINRSNSAALTRDLLLVGNAILGRYEHRKRSNNALDFDDLVLHTMNLLREEAEGLQGFGRSAAWIMYKLDQGLDHILVDEAQDTNPEHWKIIEALCSEFFAGEGARGPIRRTAFVVGDVKQSIYSFQRAAPEEFRRVHDVFTQKCKDSGREMRLVPLETSFRSTRSVLSITDAVFSDETLRQAVGGGVIQHISHRHGQAGLVEFWPLFENDDTEKGDLWSLSLTLKGAQSGSSKLATHIAEKIAGWITSREILPSYDRPVEAGDIMVLVGTRTAFVDQLVRALKLKGIPVSGVDRMMLGEQLVVQDLLAMAKFTILPQDDLNLACVLKSPFLGWSEDDLFALCYGRKGSVWDELLGYSPEKFVQQSDGPFPVIHQDKITQTIEYLKELIVSAQRSGTYEFFTSLLQQPCPADRHSGLHGVRVRLGEDALDPLEEFLNAALSFGEDGIDALPLFVQAQETGETEIKRQMEEKGGKVRIMTVHGAKGLQAPIVILPDTIKSAQSGKVSRLLWPNRTELKFPLWSPRQDEDPKAYARHYEAVKALAQQERARLLYVAMTRAEDRLYVAGYKPNRAKVEGSWYASIQAAFEKHPQTVTLDDGVMRIENKQEDKPDQAAKAQNQSEISTDLPDWIFEKAPQDAAVPRLLVPSRPVEGAVVFSPLQAGAEQRFLRGNLTHKLLQFLPDIPPERRKAAAEHFLKRNAADVSLETQDSIVTEIFKILDDPQYQPFFGENSFSEVPLAGQKGDYRMSGQIDRLVIGERDIWILDYKTNRPPPVDPKDIPQIYRDQLAAYKSGIAEVYPQHNIHCALLWTDGPRLMKVG
jgi:ATP-dependent helicase/nuclease subunit A